MGHILRAGVAQFSSVVGDVDANLQIHLDWIAKARAKNLDFLVMPELSLTGHHGCETLLDTAMFRTDQRLIQLAEAAGKMAVVVGFIEEGPAAQFYNSCAILHHGAVVFLHRKVNIPSYGKLEEDKHYATGRFVDTYRVDKHWNAGLLICADLWNPALVHLAFLHGATCLICPTSSGVEAVGVDFDNPGGWALTMRFYSTMYGAPSVMANRTGTERGLTFWGGSRIVDAFGRELAVAGTDEELINADVNFGQVRRARHLLPTLRDSNIGLVHRETTRLLKTLGAPELIRHDEPQG